MKAPILFLGRKIGRITTKYASSKQPDPEESCSSCSEFLRCVVCCHWAPGLPCLQNLTTASAHTKDQDGDLSKLSKDGEHGKARAPQDAQSNVFVLRKMVEEVFTVLYSKQPGVLWLRLLMI